MAPDPIEQEVRGAVNAPTRVQCFGLGAAGGLTAAAGFVLLVSAVLYVISNIQQRLDDERARR